MSIESEPDYPVQGNQASSEVDAISHRDSIKAGYHHEVVYVEAEC
jgi:hypothetical protein